MKGQKVSAQKEIDSLNNLSTKIHDSLVIAVDGLHKLGEKYSSDPISAEINEILKNILIKMGGK